MKRPPLRTALAAAGTLLFALGGLAAPAPPPAPHQAADEILVTRVPDVPSGAVWDVTLLGRHPAGTSPCPPARLGR